MGSTFKAEILRLQQLLSVADEGGYGVPRFQRQLVWRMNQVLDLLDSIRKGYPIGSLLFWRQTESEAMVAVTRLDGDESTPAASPRYLVLDGQQRLRTLLGVLRGRGLPPSDGTWRVFFDLKRKSFLRLPERAPVESHYFPLNGLLDTYTYLQNCKSLMERSGGRGLLAHADELAVSIRDYVMPVVVLEGDTSFAHVAEIFGRINSAGTPLSEADLLHARLLRKNFDFRRHLELLRGRLPFEFQALGDDVFMKCLTGGYSGELTIEAVSGLYEASSSRLEKLARDSIEGVVRAVEWLRKECRLPGIYYLPYSLQLVLLADIFRTRTIQRSDSGWLRRWFWSTSFTGFFAGANSAVQNASLRRLRAFDKGWKKTVAWFDANQVIQRAPEKLHLRGARARLSILALAALQPKVLYPRENAYPDITRKAILRADGPRLARIFPDAPQDERTAFANHILYPRDLSDLQALLCSGRVPAQVLASHAIDGAMVELLRSGKRVEFLLERKKLLDHHEGEFLKSKRVSVPFASDLT
jgi:hypothetical protein